MKNNLIIAALLCVVVYSVAAGDKIDVSAVVTKSDAEAILGVPVKDPKGRNKEGSDGFYDSEWSYYAMTGDKALCSTCSTRGETPHRISLRQCFPCSARSGASQPPSMASATRPF